ncbi:hypothetical protein DFS34DRAFT_275202 [Phlyctochytrium arcticum]|nr:hypothetical protein DFS34DRAFT_275202 [Phlyctochytrium arcticum]
MSFIEPLDEVDNVVRLNIDEDSLQIDDGKLKARKQDATTLLKGAGAISVYKDPLESLDSALVKLQVDHENFQQTGNKLAFRSTETLNELNVGHVNLQPNLNPSDYEAVTAEYVKGVYQGTVDTNFNLGVNASPLVDNSTIRVNSQDKWQFGIRWFSVD